VSLAQASDDETIITSAEIVPAHDGEAELVVNLRYGNGVIGQAVLDADVGFKLMKACGVSHIDKLAGHSWRKIVEGL
jgi:hypothetical protein